MSAPELSVAMSVRNGGDRLSDTLESVLEQRGVDLELIVIDDGSTDATSALLAKRASGEPRMRIFSQPNAGLTASLRRACGEARGEFVARQDAGDLSLPGRFRAQLDLLAHQPETTFVSCWTETVGPEDEPLQTLRGGLDSESAVHLEPATSGSFDPAGPTFHGSVIFRRAAYLQVGGYREAFRMAQDWDLWWRLSELGAFALVPRVLYRGRLVPDSISLSGARPQRRFAAIARAAAEARRAGADERPWIERANRLSASRPVRAGRRARARGCYFLGSLLRERGDQRCRAYFQRAVVLDPTHLKAWFRWLQSVR